MQRWILLVSAILLLAACAAKADPELEAFSDQVRGYLAARDLQSLRAVSIIPELTGERGQEALDKIVAAVPETPPDSARSINWSSVTSADATVQALRRVYSYPDNTLLLTTTARAYPDGALRLQGLNAQLLANADIPEQGFTFQNKSILQIAILGGFALNAVFMVGTCLFALYRRRWMWAPLALLGVVTVSLNWQTGWLNFDPLSFRLELFGAGVTRGLGPWDPWIVTSVLPLGAILFWALGKWRKKEPPAKPDERWSLNQATGGSTDGGPSDGKNSP